MRRLLMGFALASFVSASAFASRAEGAIIATKTSSKPFPGVTLIEGKTKAPASSFHASLVSLCTAGVKVNATANPTGLRTVPSWATSVGASLATNGDFFKPDPRVYGLAVGDGASWPLAKTGVDPAVKDQFYYDLFGWIAFGPDFVEFTHTEHVKKNAAKYKATQGYSPSSVVHTFPKGTVALVSGFPELVTEGTRVTCADPTASSCFVDRTDMRARNPRTAMGLTADRKTFILAVVDGRSATSAGMYGTELAELMEELGAWQAFNVDGGGSSEMWLKGKGTLNDPSDGSSRAVANHWGIFIGAGPAAHCLKTAPGDAGADAASPDDGGDGDDGGASSPSPSGGVGDPNGATPPEAPSDDAGEGGGCTTATRDDVPSIFGLGGLAFLAVAMLRRRRRSTSDLA